MASFEGRPKIYTIPPERGFADDLAFGLLKAAEGKGDFALARSLVLLPNRRAVRTVTEAFVRLSAAGALLLPRLAPVGDIDADEPLGTFAQGLEGEGELAPAIEPLARQIALMRLLQAQDSQRGAADSFALAGQLTAALDTLEVEGRRAADLGELVPGAGLQAHWERSLEVLKVIAEHWPVLLEERGLLDATRRRTLLLQALAARWRANPPDTPVVVAGFAAAPPAVAALMAVVSRLPRGQVVLPGLDASMKAEAWSMIAGGDGAALETHPHYGFARMLAAMQVSPAEVEPWPFVHGDMAGSPPERTALVRRAMAPAAMTTEWQAAGDAAGGLSGVQFLEGATPAEEALAVALAMRQVLKHPGKTAALVTPDRALATRVRLQLTRFGVQVDDSAGEPLASLPAGALMVALAAAAAERFAPVALLAACKHPLVMAGEGRLSWLAQVRALDRLVMRGLRPAAGLAGVQNRIAVRASAEGAEEARLSGREREEVAALGIWWRDEVVPRFSMLDALPALLSANDLLAALRAAAEALAGEGLWSGPAGRALAQQMEALDGCGVDLRRVTVRREEAPDLVGALLDGVMVRPAWGQHPQLSIWGPLEARLQSADVLILGGLNEGVWPGMPAPDPWLAPAVRRALDLPGLARRTGMQAHDFVAAMGAPEVLLTRAVREASAPSVPSRFWQRLQAASGGAGGAGILLPASEALLQAARLMDRPAQSVRVARPAPVPPLAARPKRLSVTEVSTLKADPFAFYARNILRLKPLDPLDADPTGGDRGTVVHRILERWQRAAAAPAGGVEALVDAELERFGDRPELAALWRRRVLRMVEFVRDELARTPEWVPKLPEGRGRWEVAGVVLTGRADRIDTGPGGYRVVDYKTGGMPEVAKVNSLFDTQLALMALMVEAGAVKDLAAGPVAALDYMKLSGGKEAGKMRPALGKKKDAPPVPEHMRAALADFAELVGGYLLGDRAFKAKLHPVYSRASKDYDQLARLAEWLDR